MWGDLFGQTFSNGMVNQAVHDRRMHEAAMQQARNERILREAYRSQPYNQLMTRPVQRLIKGPDGVYSPEGEGDL